ncbi:SHOCT domain-containing protein [Paeniclostridium sp. NSJ-45]|uniref:SHOCT domain-containing protein n=2 Tax=Paeniclostridium hominis TaxID=2764329 RepID=A0ABR7K3F3_9FIRM|nr:SHOCT domain-containing protein [Paeniclostridium hominis]
MDDLDKTTSINFNEKSIPAQIKEYKELLDIDAITKEEFEMKKKELLNK